MDKTNIGLDYPSSYNTDCALSNSEVLLLHGMLPSSPCYQNPQVSKTSMGLRLEVIL